MSPDKQDDTRSHETDFAAMWSSDGVTRSLAPTATGLPTDLPFLFSAGQRFGGYVIVRPLGKGGMGQVYEAEETESGRRVAIKILSRGLGDEEERERFLREGQLAASLSHPNVVYVFGTSEIQGFPVIAMELAPGGTLKDLVEPGKPVPVVTVVDAVLQVIAGLDAAAAIGILHRDIKPSNCFLDRNGRVLVGDFGLSMTTLTRDEQTVALAGSIMGTPGFASPEQLRGGNLDVRSDIYSVGATLYYLLAGRTPFEDPNIHSLITRVATEPAPPLNGIRADIPARLASVIMKCLAKQPADRYATYAALAKALEPFRSAAITPASLGRRFMAGFIDTYASALPILPFNMFMGTRLIGLEGRVDALLLAIPSLVSALLYYTLVEGRFGCGLGKAVLNLRVVDAAQGAPGYRLAFFRALLFSGPSFVVTQIFGFVVMRWASANPAQAGNMALSIVGFGSILLSFGCLAVLFSTVRRANGFAALHDLATGTRVVLRPKAIESRESLRRQSAPASLPAIGDARIGPYIVADSVKADLAALDTPMVVNGYDDRLRRGVWIELFPAGAPPIPNWRRDLDRPGRARWLSGRRSGTDSWDAYEAMEGRTLLEAIESPQPWSRVRHWVADLAHEIAAAGKDGSLPAVNAGRVWITADDRARLLDWPPPSPAAIEPATARLRPPAPAAMDPASAGLRPSTVTTIPDSATAQRFLYGVAVGALTGTHPDTAGRELPATPLPLPARALLLSLREGKLAGVEAVDASASATLRDAAVFPRQRRMMQLALCALLPATIGFAVFAAVKFQVRSQTANPNAYALKVCLGQLVGLDRAERNKPGGLTPRQRQVREHIEIYVAERLRAAAEDSAEYARAFPATAELQRENVMAQRVLASARPRSPEEIREAEATVAKVIADHSANLNRFNRPAVLWSAIGIVIGGGAALVALLGLIGAFVVRGGFTLRTLGAAVVTPAGEEVSRLRALLRAFVAWSPVAIWLLLLKANPPIDQSTIATMLLYMLVPALLIAGAVYAWLHPSRGIQDRIASTWIVPR
jgi:uncharacterized RDD family membrane protein YckC